MAQAPQPPRELRDLGTNHVGHADYSPEDGAHGRGTRTESPPPEMVHQRVYNPQDKVVTLLVDERLFRIADGIMEPRHTRRISPDLSYRLNSSRTPVIHGQHAYIPDDAARQIYVYDTHTSEQLRAIDYPVPEDHHVHMHLFESRVYAFSHASRGEASASSTPLEPQPSSSRAAESEPGPSTSASQPPVPSFSTFQTPPPSPSRIYELTDEGRRMRLVATIRRRVDWLEVTEHTEERLKCFYNSDWLLFSASVDIRADHLQPPEAPQAAYHQQPSPIEEIVVPYNELPEGLRALTGSHRQNLYVIHRFDMRSLFLVMRGALVTMRIELELPIVEKIAAKQVVYFRYDSYIDVINTLTGGRNKITPPPGIRYKLISSVI